jgi:hypothetical protein
VIPLDADNEVVRLCVAGVEAEQRGDGELATERYTAAWEASSNDLEACVAAHYLARVQAAADARLRWNELALERAVAAGSPDAFMASLELNVGAAHEAIGNLELAALHYDAASQALDRLQDDALATSLRGPVRRAVERIGVSTSHGTG